MPLNPNLDINITVAQDTAIDGGLTTVETEVDNVVGAPLNLSTTERRKTPSIDQERELPVKKAIETLGPLYPNLLGPDVTLARATNLWSFRNKSLSYIARLKAELDILTDASINAENICLKFAEDMRDMAERYKERNVAGADVVWEELKDLHKREPAEEPIP
jgi:hypothetical protein